MRFLATTLALSMILLLTGCHAHARHRHRPPVFSAYPAVTLDTDKQIGAFHSIHYTQVGKSLEQTLDLYLPLSQKPPYPLIIWVHGGSWMYGDKNEGCLPCQTLGSKYAVASINYRLDQESQFPSQIWDLKAAVRFLRAHAKEYKLDPDRFGAWGSSAGGHLVALLGTSGGDKGLEGTEGYNKYSSKVQAVVDWCGPSDFNTAQSQASPDCKIKFEGQTSPVYVLMGGRMDHASLAKASPVTYVSKDDPPFLIMHGDIDDAIPYAQSEELYNVLRKAGVDAEYHLLPGYGHAFSSPEQLKLVEDFFAAKLKDPKVGK